MSIIHILQTTTYQFPTSTAFYTLHRMLLEKLGLSVTHHHSWQSVIDSGAKNVLHLCHRDLWKTIKQEDGTVKSKPDSVKWQELGPLEDTYPSGIDNIRGSRYVVNGVVVIPTYHPENNNQEYSNWVLTEIDLKRVLRDQQDGYKEQTHTKHICYRYEDAIKWLDVLLAKANIKDFYSCCDIEGSLDSGGVTCIGFSLSKDEGFTIPFHDLEGDQMFNTHQETVIWDLIQEVFEKVWIVFHNALYDMFVLAYGYGIIVHKLRDDTMLKTFELYCEFSKSLGFCVSIYTDHHYYKNERLAPTLHEQLDYNIKDCCLTHECNEVMDRSLKKDKLSLNAYKERMQVMWIALYYELQGIMIDNKKKSQQLKSVEKELEETQKELDILWLDTELGKEATQKANETIIKLQKERETYVERKTKTMAEITKRTADARPITKKLINDERIALNGIERINGKLNGFKWPSFNAKSSKIKEDLLYHKKGLGLKMPRLPKDEDGEPQGKTAELTIIKLLGDKKTPDGKKPLLQKLLRVIKIRTTMSDIKKLTVDPLDGRLRCGYNVAGPVSGRWSNSESNIPETGYKIWN